MPFSRRRFLCGSAALGVSLPFLSRALQAQAASDKILVIMNMSGGNDGFNTVIPLSQYTTYAGLRPTIGVPIASIMSAKTGFDTDYTKPSASTSAYGFPPYLTKIRDYYAQGKVAVLMGGALPVNANGLRAHPNATFAWMTGQINNYLETTIGWVGNALDQFGTVPADLAPMLSASGQTPLLFGSAKNSVLSFYGKLEWFQQPYPYPQPWQDYAPQQAAVAALQGYATPNAVSELTRNIAIATANDLTRIAAYAKDGTASDYITTFVDPANAGLGLQQSSIKLQFQQIARLILAGNDSKVYQTQGGEFDTHANQATEQPGSLVESTEGMVEFMEYLTAKNPAAANRVVVVSISEFGRKPLENSTGGTDHGSSSIHFAMGAGIKGGAFGHYPSLSPSGLDSNGYATVEYDYRSYLADVIGIMGADAVPILGGSFGGRLGFV